LSSWFCYRFTKRFIGSNRYSAHSTALNQIREDEILVKCDQNDGQKSVTKRNGSKQQPATNESSLQRHNLPVRKVFNLTVLEMMTKKTTQIFHWTTICQMIFVFCIWSCSAILWAKTKSVCYYSFDAESKRAFYYLKYTSSSESQKIKLLLWICSQRWESKKELILKPNYANKF